MTDLRLGRTASCRRRALLLLLLGLNASALLPQERFRRVPPPPDPTPELRLPNIETATLANGLAVSAVFREGQPFINIQLIVHAGEADSKALPGIASMTAQLVLRGTLQMSAAEIDRSIEAIGGTLSVNTRLDQTVFSFQFLEEHLDRALELLGQMFLQPSFPQVELDLQRLAQYYDILNKEKDPGFVAKRQLLRELLKSHPYGQSYYNKSTLKNILLPDVVRFFRSHYYANRAHVILTGNLSLRTAVRKVSHSFKAWARGPSVPLALPPPQAVTELRVVFIDVPQSTGGTIYLGNITPAMTSPEYPPLAVAHQVLGGSVNSRLIMNLRESKGYAYFVFSQIEAFSGFSAFIVRARVDPERVFASVQEILAELRLLKTAPLPTDEVELAKSYLLGSFPLSMERLDRWAEMVAELKAFDLGDDYWNRYGENILMVNSLRIFDLAQGLPLDTPVVVIVGDKNMLASQLISFDKVDIFDVQGAFQYSLVKESDR